MSEERTQIPDTDEDENAVYIPIGDGKTARVVNSVEEFYEIINKKSIVYH